VPVETLLSFFRTFPDFDAREIGTRVRTPALVVHGTDDLNTPCEDAKLIARVMPNARYRPFAGRGHLPNLTARAEFCEVLSAFVGGEAVPGVEPVR
jgi:pimeloyl-ACP methyl ester carboxylesterase